MNERAMQIGGYSPQQQKAASYADCLQPGIAGLMTAGSMASSPTTPRDRSEFEMEIERLGRATETTHQLLNQLHDRLSLVTVPQPPSENKAGAESIARSGLSQALRENAYRVENANAAIVELIASLSI